MKTAVCAHGDHQLCYGEVYQFPRGGLPDGTRKALVECECDCGHETARSGVNVGAILVSNTPPVEVFYVKERRYS